MSKEPTIEELKARLYVLESLEEAKAQDVWKGIEERSAEIAKGIPTTVFEREEMYPNKAVSDARGLQHPQVLTTFDQTWFFIILMVPPLFIMALLLLSST